ncbi:eukaryotic translation initiation factor 4E type 2 (IF4E2) [Vairimorpha necatrix]|uniref:Eukaryotic translation initiation factor 4E type 2 (IF4E2) n=1 Tax=Vairimorpha necatrix TaxID=6039 RepID=A0AAX4J8A7_9MICR
MKVEQRKKSDFVHTWDTNYVVTFKEIDNSEVNKETYNKDLETLCKIENPGNILYFLERLKSFDRLDNFYLNVFKEGILPLWEDENNKNGCSWSLVLRKEICQRYFEKILLRMCLGFFKSFEPTGIVGVNKDGKFKLSIWSKNIPQPNEHVNVINEIKEALDINYNVSFQYKKHSKLLDPKEE